MTKYYVEILEPTEDSKSMQVKTQEEKLSLLEAETAKTATVLLPDEVVRVHICRHGDGPNGTNEECTTK